MTALDSSVHVLAEKHDEEQIIRELKGEILSTYIYKFNQAGRDVVALSYAGVKRYARKRGHFFIIPCECCKKSVHVDGDDQEFRALITIRDGQSDTDFVGASSAKRNQPFAYTIAVNKAERNAYRKSINEKELALVIEEYRKQQYSSPLKPSA